MVHFRFIFGHFSKKWRKMIISDNILQIWSLESYRSWKAKVSWVEEKLSRKSERQVLIKICVLFLKQKPSQLAVNLRRFFCVNSFQKTRLYSSHLLLLQDVPERNAAAFKKTRNRWTFRQFRKTETADFARSFEKRRKTHERMRDETHSRR